MDKKERENTNVDHIGLRREVGLVSGVNFMLSFVIGSGIFVTPGTVLAQAGSVGMTLSIWAACGLISFFVLIGALNCYSVKIYVKSQDFLSYTKMVTILFLIGCGVYLIVTGNALQTNPGFEGTNYSVTSITQAIYFCLFTYDGGFVSEVQSTERMVFLYQGLRNKVIIAPCFSAIVSFITTVTEEMKNPEKNILRSILIGLTIITLTFVLLNVTFLTALTPDEIANSDTVIAEFSIKLFGVAGGVISSLIICLSLLTGMMSNLFCASRIGYVAAREGHMMDFLCCIHATRHTPAPAVILQVLLALVFYFFVGGNTNALIDTYAFFIWLSYGMAMVCVLLLRRQLPDAPRPFRVPTIVPVLVALLSLHLFVTSLLSGPARIIIIFGICVSLSALIYFVFIFRKLRFSSLAKLQRKLKNIFNLVMPSEEPNF